MLVLVVCFRRDCRVYARRSHWWFLSGSLALLADAGHMLTDTAACFSPYSQCNFPVVLPPFATFRLAKIDHARGVCECHRPGGITILIVWEAIERFRTPRPVGAA